MALYLRYNSTIQTPKAPCNECNDGIPKPLISGLCQYHYKQKLNKKSREKQIARDEKKNEEKEQWFNDRRKEMVGRCVFCGGKTCKDDDEKFKRSLAHLFAKREYAFPSIATHEENWLELCFFGKSCHTNFDNSILTFDVIKEKYPKAWEVIIKKTKILCPLMTNQERGRIPEIVINAFS